MTTPKIVIKALTEYFRFLAGGVVLAVLLAGYFLLISPLVTEVQSTQGTARKNAEAELKTQQAYLEALKQSNAKYDQVLPKANREKIDAFIPSEPDFPGLLLTMKSIVSQAQLTLDGITVGQGGQVAVTNPGTAQTDTARAANPATAQAATVAGVNIQTQDVSITVSGGHTYQDFKRLLTLIESSQRLFDVISVNYAAPAGTTGGTSTATGQPLKWDIVLRTYYLPTR